MNTANASAQQQRYKSEKQLLMEQKRETSQRNARERKREYIIEDNTPTPHRNCYEGKSQLPEASHYCILVMTENNEFMCIPVNNEWVHFETRVMNQRAANTSEMAEAAMDKSTRRIAEKMKSTTSETSIFRKNFEGRVGAFGGVGAGGRGGGGGVGGGRRGRPSSSSSSSSRSSKNDFEDDDEMMSGGRDEEEGGFDYDGGVDDDEEFVDAELENPQVYYKPPAELEDSDEEGLNEFGKELKRVLDGGPLMRPDAATADASGASESAAAAAVKSEANSEDEESKSGGEEGSDGANAEPKKRGRGRPKKTDKEPKKIASPASSSTASPSSASASLAGKRKREEEESPGGKKVKLEVEDITDPDELERAVRALFVNTKSISYKEFGKRFITNVNRSETERQARMSLLVGILSKAGIQWQKKGKTSFLVKSD